MPRRFLDVTIDSTSLLRVGVCFTDDTPCLAPYWLARPPRPFSLSAWPSRFSRGGVPTCNTPFHACLAPSHRVQGLDSRFPAPFLSRRPLRVLTPFRGQSANRLLPDTSHHRFNVYAATQPDGTVLICIPISNLSALGLHPCSAFPARVGVSRH